MESPYPDRFWNFLVELKGHSIYLGEYLHVSEAHDNQIKVILAITSSSSIAGWAIWNHLAYGWAFLIALSQVISAVKPLLPFERRIKPLRALCYAYDELSLEVERTWFKIENGSLSESEINELLYNFRKTKLALWKKILDEVSLPHNAKLHAAAEILTTNHIKQQYSI